MEALQVLKFSLKHGTSVLNFTLGDSWEEKEQNLMKLVEEKGMVPEDPGEYEKGLTGTPTAPSSTPRGSKRWS